MKNLFFTTCLLLISIPNFAQRIGFEEIDPKNLSPWVIPSPEMYQKVYHFGDSEMESDLIIFFANGKVYAQIRKQDWNSSGKARVMNFTTLTNVKIEGNKFFSNETNGEFVIYDNGNEKIKGLKVYKPWSGINEDPNIWEMGTESYEIALYFNGKYPQASYKLLKKEDLAKMSKEDLKIMRNEIYARYGYKFTIGGEMEKYFAKQDWYQVYYHDDVNKFLTTLEATNIKLIQELEK